MKSGNKVYPENEENLSFVHHLFDQQCAEYADQTAIQFGNDRITYAALNDKANSLSWTISSKFPSQPIIAISSTRSIEMIIGVLAILKAGKAYLPLDPHYPKDRLIEIVKDAGISECLAIDREKIFFETLGLQVLTSDVVDAIKPSSEFVQGSLAYILYTSGSTGKPKGVCMRHKALVNLINWQKKHSKATSQSNTLQFAPLSFDVSFQEIFATLTTGGKLVLIEDDLRLDPYHLLRFIQQSSVHRLFLPFIALQQLAEVADANNFFPDCLQEIMTAGEQLKITPQVRRFFSILPHCNLYNQYGPTEAHVVTSLKLEGDPSRWPSLPTIGKAIDNTEIFILDERLNLLQQGNTGELCISGVCLAEGYLNNPSLTSEKFVLWYHPDRGPVWIYRTGDLARFQSDRTIEFLGRGDEQVKIRGHRVELGEIEVALNKMKGVQQAIITAREDIPGQKRLIAYLVSSDQTKDTIDIRQSLQRVLPEYMMPSAFVWLDNFPKTSSGKVDKKSLPKPEMQRPELSSLYRAPATEIEKRIADLWSGLLQINGIGIEDNFFELGGNSLLAVKTVVDLKQLYHFDLPVTKLYQYPTIKGIANYFTREQRVQLTNTGTKKNSGDIAVVGMSGRFPGADTIDELWTLLKEGKETIRFFSDEELHYTIPETLKKDPSYVKARGILNNADKFDAPFFGINPKVAELMDPQQRIFLEIAWDVLEQTGHLPEKYDGLIGVFAGSGNNSYYLNNVLSNKKLIDNVGSFQVMTVNEKDYIATRVAYQLNLKGPAVSVYSGCSTSLLAIAQAAESIRNGRCDIALAGGVAIHSPIHSGQYYEEGAMFSPDGRCRPFDKDAKGTVFSDGAGVVLLKRLEDAVKDNDTIYAVLKGIGYNNDGGDKGSFTAPSAEGQAGAIVQAINDAGIDASTISYIETHGTATPLGDPIEIDGLNMAFGPQDRKQYCAIGSLKSNIGHLTAAAGVAGFIKTTLSLYHKQLPASLHFKESNPNIQFKDSPFFVNTSLQRWESDQPRRAGVSSFGVGGTNVHVILQEFDNEKNSIGSKKPFQLITWSSKSEASRENYASQLVSFLDKNNELVIPSLAYTLQVTRKDFNFRRFAISSGSVDLHSKLSADVIPPSEIKKLEEIPEEVVFVFPGQGSQYNNMGRDLYLTEPVFKNAVDECAAILEIQIKEDIRKILYPEAGVSDSDTRLNQTEYTQPALFTIEYAMAKLWMSWGIMPAAMIGHSIGEYVAAHLAGVFSLEDALILLSARSRLMASMPPGKMLSVQISEDQLRPILPPALSIAAVNTSKLSVVAGKANDIEEFESILNKKGITARVLKTSHAFHSEMMEPVLDPFLKVASSVSYNTPHIPIVSTLTGKWLSESEITDPSYWSRQLRNTVRFAHALETISEGKKRLLLEVGPGNTTSSFARQQLNSKGIVSISGITREPETESEYYSVLRSLGQLWLNGIQPQWKSLYETEPAKLPDVPSYAFDRKRLWVEPIILTQQADNSLARGSITQVVATIDKQPVSKHHQKENILKRIRKILEDAAGIETETDLSSTSFIEMGLDSLLLTQMAFTIKKEFNIAVTFRQLNEDYSTIDSLASFLHAGMPEDATPVCISEPHVRVTDNPARLVLPDNNNNESLLALISQQLELLTRQVALLEGKASENSNSSTANVDRKIRVPAIKAFTNNMETRDQEIQRRFQDAPIPGAKLGKDQYGNPAWFIPDETRPGKYLQIDFFEN